MFVAVAGIKQTSKQLEPPNAVSDSAGSNKRPREGEEDISKHKPKRPRLEGIVTRDEIVIPKYKHGSYFEDPNLGRYQLLFEFGIPVDEV